jgi:pimeloyl-ACP methyl ester carboxylesterase
VANRVYCISGLGADHRVFRNLAVPGWELVPLPWIPFHEDDTLPSYAQKFARQIPGEEPVILGLSFGGMLATEIGKITKTREIIIVSSAKGPQELNIHGGAISRWLISSRIIPSFLFTVPNPVVLSYFGAHTREEKEVMRDVIRHTDGRFMKWALQALLTWKNSTVPAGLLHIHGTADRVIPSAAVKPDAWIAGGSHMMIFNRAADVNDIIARYLQDA